MEKSRRSDSTGQASWPATRKGDMRQAHAFLYGVDALDRPCELASLISDMQQASSPGLCSRMGGFSIALKEKKGCQELTWKNYLSLL